MDMLERVLLVWAVRQPSQQGLLDVALPLLLVFLSSEAGVEEVGSLDVQAIDALSNQVLVAVEADLYWCLSRLLSELMDNYTEGQPGLQRSATQLRHLFACQAPAFNVVELFEENGLQVALLLARWLGCLLVRELSLPMCLRLWDTLLAEVAISQLATPSAGPHSMEGLAPFLVCLCGATLLAAPSSLEVASMDELMQFAQKPALGNVSEEELAALISEAYVLLSSAYAKALEMAHRSAVTVEEGLTCGASAAGASTMSPTSSPRSSPSASEEVADAMMKANFPASAGFL
eukprot:CAMPEP_0178417678 /NCGR_PEP_ID=MMETSP0689_2-20121128/24694_1 /TAXON_ID=160604 /ORGANISM="Amphidinium massartii, Strain CS-259" /LENGTH=289 /DNA_ID=CAMNT_0020039043 /DNA_START=45 /DNA_END=911 /DNA_ORIENTATION=+